MATLSTNSSHRVVPYTHDALVTDQTAAHSSVGAIRDAVHAVRFNVPLEKSSYPELKELFMLPYVVGVVLSIGVALFARWVGFDRDRAFYPTVLIVIASYYVLFAVMSGSVETVLLESIMMVLFAVAAVAGFKASPWIVVAALAGHGVQDAVHSHIIANAGVPAWWPAWCLAYDVGAAGALAWILTRAESPRLVGESAV